MKAIVSLGNPLKSDDNIANLVLKKIRAKNTAFFKGWMNPENLIPKIMKSKPTKIIFIDALDFNGKIGEVRLFDLSEIQNTLTTTHNIPINMIQKFFPKKTIKIIGIQPKKIEYGMQISVELKEKFEEIVLETQKIINSL